MKILVVGTGYVGLVTGACFAEMGHQVMCLDIDRKKISSLNDGKIPFFEPGLEEIVKRNAAAGRLHFTTDYAEGVAFATLYFIAVSTPSKEDGSANLTYFLQAIDSIGEHMQGEAIIVNKSTVPVGTAQLVKERLEKQISHPFHVVSNPEFLKEGDAVNDFMKPDRIIIGSDEPKVAALMQELYAPFNLSHERLLVMDPISAEMTKYAANAMLAARISFMNEIAGLCEIVGADINRVRKGIGSDRRIGYAFLYAGVGYGGSCFPKDIQALAATAKTHAYDTPLLHAIEEVNARQKQVMGQKIARYFAKELAGKIIAIWGLSFKPGTDDLREAPALVLIRFLLEQGAYVRLFDPIAMPKAKLQIPFSPQITWCQDEFDTAKDAHAIVLMTEWKQFRYIDFETVLKKMQGRAFFDGRNQYTPSEMTAHGFDYISIGRPDGLLEKASHLV